MLYRIAVDTPLASDEVKARVAISSELPVHVEFEGVARASGHEGETRLVFEIATKLNGEKHRAYLVGKIQRAVDKVADAGLAAVVMCIPCDVVYVFPVGKGGTYASGDTGNKVV